MEWIEETISNIWNSTIDSSKRQLQVPSHVADAVNIQIQH